MTSASQVVTSAEGRPLSDWQYVCVLALSTLEITCKRSINGDIFMSELQIIQDRKKQMDKLCNAAAGKNSTLPSARELICQHYTASSESSLSALTVFGVATFQTHCKELICAMKLSLLNFDMFYCSVCQRQSASRCNVCVP